MIRLIRTLLGRCPTCGAPYDDQEDHAKMNKQHLTSRLPGTSRDTTSALFPRARLTAHLCVPTSFRPAAAWSDAH